MLVLREKLHRDQLVVSGKAIHCIVPDCEGYAFIFPNEQTTACIVCRASLCVKCKRGTHPTLTCVENQALSANDSLDDILFSRKWKRCPCCGIPVEKIEGCNYIACFSPICKGKKGLCYKCGKELDEEQHFSHYTNKGPYGDTCNTLDGLPG
ncbi:unnamed protein product [Blepharisma stoltei]|uniref:RING-type domain-containing protein n=1 Tax=Blepharisma stoltei TaxID=1481888 RepID=A0AAU9JCU7_9CILI|nr:unnamed protein product [Blepharisma stoltei]